jgi:hypothetical protein
MRMLPRLFAIALIALPFSAVADTGQMTDMLRRIPDAALPPGAPRLDITYGNGDAVRGVARNGNLAWPADDWAHEYAALRTASPGQAAALAEGEGEAMSLLYRDWVHGLEVSAPPARMGLHFLYPDSEMRLRGALFGRGMEVATRNGQMVLWEGETDHETDPARADTLNPFGGADGLALRFIVEGEWALWASGWPQIELMQAGGGPSLAERGDVAQIMGGAGRCGAALRAACFGADIARPDRGRAGGVARPRPSWRGHRRRGRPAGGGGADRVRLRARDGHGGHRDGPARALARQHAGALGRGAGPDRDAGRAAGLHPCHRGRIGARTRRRRTTRSPR